MTDAKRAAPREGGPLQKNTTIGFSRSTSEIATSTPRRRAGRRQRPEAAIQRTAVYDGRKCVGSIIVRGKTDYEAFDRDKRSVGVFKTQREAVGAIPDNEEKKCS